MRLYSRVGNDLTDRFPLIVEALGGLRSRSDAHVPGGIAPARRTALQRMYWCAAVAWPRILGTAVFVCIVVAMIKAYRNLFPATGLPEAERALSQLIALITVTATLGVIYFVLVWLRRIIGAWLNTRLMGKRRQWPARFSATVRDGPSSDAGGGGSSSGSLPTLRQTLM